MDLLTCLCILLLPSSCLLLTQDDFVFPKDRTGEPSTRIIGGVEVTPHSYPFVVALFIHVSGSQLFCGGSLISSQYVLTAAHCLDEKPDYIEVYLGSHDLSVSEATREVVQTRSYYVHTGWDNNTLQNDIALIRLPMEVNLNRSYINTIDFATSGQTYAEEDGVTVGWGKTSDVSTYISSVLMKVSSRILSNGECAASGFSSILRSSHVCVSGTGPVGSCNGDSGGPLLVGNVQVGIVSFGYKYCTYEYPSVYTRVSDYRNWIIQHTGNGGETLGFSLVVVLAVLVNFFNNL